jgi:hypothetical protein
MNELRQVDNIKLLQELKKRIAKKKLRKEEIFNVLETSKEPELITEYKKVDYSKLTKEDWKKACQALEKDKNYQEEVELWDSIDDIDDEE